MHLIAINDQVSDGSLGIGTVYSNAKRVGTMSRSITAVISLFNVMDVILQQFYVRASATYVYAQRGKPLVGGTVVADFKTLDSHVTLVVNRKYAASRRWSEVRGLQDRRLAWIASKSNEPIGRVAGCVDADQFFVDFTPNVDGTASPRSVCGMLNGAPRRRLSAGIRIISGRRDVERGVWLAKRRGDAR